MTRVQSTGRQTEIAATRYDKDRRCVTLRASRNAGIVAELIRKAFSTWASCRAAGTSVPLKTGASKTG